MTAQKRRADDASLPSQTGSSKRPKEMTNSMRSTAAPLAERLRPQSLDEFVGQPHLIGSDSLLINLLNNGSTGSIIFWGPPG